MSNKRHDYLRTRQLRDTARIGVFLLLIVLPLLCLILQRDLAITVFPVPRSFSDISSFPTEFKSYFAASVNLRGTLAGWHNRLRIWLNGPTRTSKIIVGKNGWLFLRWMVMGRDHRVEDPLSPAALADWKKQFAANQRLCAELGVPYLVVLIPSKQAVYPEHLPDAVYEQIGEESGVAQMAEFLSTNATDIRFVELLTDLRARKTGQDLFYKTDTHWNSLGGLIGANAVSARLHEMFPIIAPTTMADIQVRAVEAHGGNEARLLGRAGSTREIDVKIDYPDGREVTYANGKPLDLPLLDVRQLGVSMATRFPAAPIRSAVIFHNSFGYAMVRHLGRNFQTTHWFWSDFSTAQVRTHQPDVVIHLLTF
jgi:hypothetical protein